MLLLNKSRGTFSIVLTHNHHPIHHRPTKNRLHMPDRDGTGTEAAVLCEIREPWFTLVAFWIMRESHGQFTFCSISLACAVFFKCILWGLLLINVSYLGGRNQRSTSKLVKFHQLTSKIFFCCFSRQPQNEHPGPPCLAVPTPVVRATQALPWASSARSMVPPHTSWCKVPKWCLVYLLQI